MKAIDDDWIVENTKRKIKKLVREFKFKNFIKALDFTNRVGKLAEVQGHHPDIYIHSYNKVRIKIWTHEIKGLHKNDFILAAKIDKLLR